MYLLDTDTVLYSLKGHPAATVWTISTWLSP